MTFASMLLNLLARNPENNLNTEHIKLEISNGKNDEAWEMIEKWQRNESYKY